MKNETEIIVTNQGSICYQEKDLQQYLKNKMPDELVEIFESHCETCDICAAALWRQKESDFESKILDNDKDLHQKFLNKIRDLLKHADKPKEIFMPRGFK